MSSDSMEVSNGFHFIWNIANIDVCFYQKSIFSPMFVACNLNKTEWQMTLHPFIREHKFLLALIRTNAKNGEESVSIDFSVSVSTSYGNKMELKECKNVKFFRGSSVQFYWIYGSTEKLYENDLTVYCHMIKSGNETLPYISCSARTIVGKERRRGVWKMKSFRYLSPGVSKKFVLVSTETQSPHIELSGSLSRKSRFFHIELKVTHDKPIIIFGKISLLTAEGTLKWPTIENFFFDGSASSQTYKFPLIVKLGYCAPRSLDSRSLYLLPNGALNLLWEFNISTGLQNSEIVESDSLIQNYRELTHREILRKEYEKLMLKSQTEDESTDETHETSDGKSNTFQNLKEDLKKLYKQKKHCDVILQIENESFPAHRSILCSRSPVFSLMFDHDMKETVNKKVDIVDIDADTLNRFLLFLYSETLGDLQWDRATRLLYAASKYQVASLKKECSSFLISHLTTSNVCEGLVLAELYLEDQLKSECQSFVFENASEIFSSTEWESFTVENPLVSAKMLREYFALKKSS